MSWRLYQYNQHPVSPELQNRFANQTVLDQYLGLIDNRSSWAKKNTLKIITSGAWRNWVRSDYSSQHGGPIYKLYISPRFEHLPDILLDTLDALAYSSAFCFKLGRDIYSLQRPDKLVAYFRNIEELYETVDFLLLRLKGCIAQGVPFTSEIAEDGLLSWGIDPPANEPSFGLGDRESWRLWVTNRLAVALLAARQVATGSLEPWQFALQRLSLEAIDLTTWTPTHTMWL